MEDIIFTISLLFFLGMFVLLSITLILSGIFLVKERRRVKPAGFSPGVSVVIPAFNEGEKIRKCVESALASDYPEKEIIVVDDGSTDNTIEEVKRLPVTLVKQDHKGKVAALNKGIAKAKHEFIVTIDADVFLQKNSLQEIVKPLSNPRVGAASGVANVHNKKNVWGAFQSVEYPYISFLREIFSSLFRVTPGICGAFTCFRRTALNKIGGFQTTTASEDFDIPFQLAKQGYDIAVSPKAICTTIVPSSFSAMFKQRVRWVKGIEQTILNHGFPRRLAVSFIFVNLLFWFIYAFFALPLMSFHIAYWLPSNSATLFDLSLS